MGSLIEHMTQGEIERVIKTADIDKEEIERLIAGWNVETKPRYWVKNTDEGRKKFISFFRKRRHAGQAWGAKVWFLFVPAYKTVEGRGHHLRSYVVTGEEMEYERSNAKLKTKGT